LLCLDLFAFLILFGASCRRVDAGRWLLDKMNLQDIEPINTTEHLMEIKKSSKRGKWLLKTTRNGVVLESYRPLTKDEALQIIGAALVEDGCR
jgi:hypothetical protein